MNGSKNLGAVRRGGNLRWAPVLVALVMTGLMGIRARSGRADSFASAVMAGRGRAALKITRVGTLDVGGEAQAEVEALARLTFSSELSRFGHGLYVRTTFALPPNGERAVLVVDLDRTRGARTWTPGHSDIRATFYTVGDDGGMEFAGETRGGSVSLEASVATSRGAGFRLRGWLEAANVGADGVRDSEDDQGFEIEFTLESQPTPEALSGAAPPPPPSVPSGTCGPPWCWEDPAYDDSLYLSPGCGDATVGYETTDDGCTSSEPVPDDGVVVEPDPGTWPSDPGSLTVDDGSSSGCDTTSTNDDQASACEGSDDGSSSGSDGCDGGDSGSSDASACDSGSSGDAASGCDAGCTGDTLSQGAPPKRGLGARRSGHAGFGWFAAGLFLSALGAAMRRKR